MQNGTGPPEVLTLGAIRNKVKMAFEETAAWPPGIATLDTEIDCDFGSLLGRISQGIRKTILMVAIPPKGQKFTIGGLAEYIFDHQVNFAPLPEESQDQNPETPESA